MFDVVFCLFPEFSILFCFDWQENVLTSVTSAGTGSLPRATWRSTSNATRNSIPTSRWIRIQFQSISITRRWCNRWAIQLQQPQWHPPRQPPHDRPCSSPPCSQACNRCWTTRWCYPPWSTRASAPPCPIHSFLVEQWRKKSWRPLQKISESNRKHPDMQITVQRMSRKWNWTNEIKLTRLRIQTADHRRSTRRSPPFQLPSLNHPRATVHRLPTMLFHLPCRLSPPCRRLCPRWSRQWTWSSRINNPPCRHSTRSSDSWTNRCPSSCGPPYCPRRTKTLTNSSWRYSCPRTPSWRSWWRKAKERFPIRTNVQSATGCWVAAVHSRCTIAPTPANGPTSARSAIAPSRPRVIWRRTWACTVKSHRRGRRRGVQCAVVSSTIWSNFNSTSARTLQTYKNPFHFLALLVEWSCRESTHFYRSPWIFLTSRPDFRISWASFLKCSSSISSPCLRKNLISGNNQWRSSEINRKREIGKIREVQKSAENVPTKMKKMIERRMRMRKMNSENSIKNNNISSHNNCNNSNSNNNNNQIENRKWGMPEVRTATTTTVATFPARMEWTNGNTKTCRTGSRTAISRATTKKMRK